jgi:hypothetical protein
MEWEKVDKFYDFWFAYKLNSGTTYVYVDNATQLARGAPPLALILAAVSVPRGDGAPPLADAIRSAGLYLLRAAVDASAAREPRGRRAPPRTVQSRAHAAAPARPRSPAAGGSSDSSHRVQGRHQLQRW